MSMPETETTEMAESVLARLLHTRLEKEKSLLAGDREAVSYRISEIMVCAKELYTTVLPRLLQGDKETCAMEEEIAGLRMSLLHLRDLVTDFDNVFLEAMHHERLEEPEKVYDHWKPQQEDQEEGEWTAEELGLSPEEYEE